MASACSSQGSAPGSTEYWRNRPASVASASAASCSGGLGGQLLGRLDGVQRFDLLELSGHALVQQREEQLILVGEVGVDGPLGVAGRVGDLVDRGGMEAPAGEHLAGGVKQPGTGLLSALRSGQSGHAVLHDQAA